MSVLKDGVQAVLLAVLFAVAVTLHGCGCVHPTPQLTWRPDGDALNAKTRRVENGIWRGNPTWQWYPELESEDYECVTMHPSKSICVVWTSHEWNCGEEDFGICKCEELSSVGDFCQRWSCHSLEADQEICGADHSSDGNEGESCHYDPFPMNYNTYNSLLEMQAGGQLTTGESHLRWWSYSSLSLYGRLLAETDAAQQEVVLAEYMDYLSKVNATAVEEALHRRGNTTARNLAAIDWPPIYAYNPVARHVFFEWHSVCIVNGDNLAMARHNCHQWREIETEISQCMCEEGDLRGKACKRWTCEERDVGLFSVLFRTQQSIDPYTVGVELEEYTCSQFDINGHCKAWRGVIESPEEVEFSGCECIGSTCHAENAIWECDEWELPKTRDLFFEEYYNSLISFIAIEIFICCTISRGHKSNHDGSGDTLCAAVCISTCAATIMLPFLVVTFGLYGFLFAGLPFWTCRCGLLACVCLKNFKLPASERASQGTRLKRGASGLIGKGMAARGVDESSNQT